MHELAASEMSETSAIAESSYNTRDGGLSGCGFLA